MKLLTPMARTLPSARSVSNALYASIVRSNSLGMTETCGPHTIDRMDVDLPERLRGSFGHSVPGVEHKVVDPQTGKTTYVFSCFNQDQPLDCVDWKALDQRLRQNSVQEKLTAEWLDHCLIKLGLREMQRI